MLAMGVTGTPGDILGRLAELRAAAADTVYFHLYDVTDLHHVRLLGREIPRRSPTFSTERPGPPPTLRFLSRRDAQTRRPPGASPCPPRPRPLGGGEHRA
jgi:hypothetical protein